MPKVSVIIPAYNAMAYLPAAVDSVFQQTFADYEVLIVDDGSLDGTGEWVSQISDPRVRLISQANQGSAKARNTGITAARGEYIALLDADDLWEPTKLEKQVRYLDENPSIGLVDTWTVLADECGNSTGRVVVSHAEENAWEQLVQFKTVCCCDSTPLIRRSCFETVGLFEPNLLFLEDLDLWIRLAARYDFGVVKEPLVRYRQHSSSKSNNCQATLEAFRQIIEKEFKFVPTELLYLRNRGYGRVNFYLASRCLNNKDDREARYFLQQAIAHYPQLRYSKNYISLSLALMLMQWFGTQTYDKARSLVHALRRRISGFAT